MIPNDWPASLSFALETTIGVTALVVLVLLLRRPVAKRFGAGAAYALWALPLVRLVLPPLPSNWVFRPSLGADAAAPAAFAPPAPPVVEEGITFVVRASEGVPVLLDPPLPTLPQISTASPIDWAGLLISVWLVGAVIAFALTMYRHRKFMEAVDIEAEDANPALQEMASETAAEIGLKRDVRVCSSYIPDGPMVTGLTRSVVLLPAWFEEDYSLSEQRAAIAHELTHVKRGDLWALQCANIAMALQWFNPFAHLALRAFRRDQEAACDADVLRRTTMTPRAYGGALVKAVKLAHGNRNRLMAAGLPLNHAIKDRLMLMQNPVPSFTKRLAGASVVALVGAMAMFATASAQEKDTQLTINNGELTIDGKTYTDRRFILLDDPIDGSDFEVEFEAMPDFDFDFDLEFSELSEDLNEIIVAAQIEFDAEELAGLANLSDLSELSELAELSKLSEILPQFVEGIEISTSDDGSTKIFIPQQSIKFAGNIENLEAFEEQMEAFAERMEERAEAFAARIEAKSEMIEARTAGAEKLAERYEAQAQAHAARAEAWAEKYAHKMEMKFAPSMEAIDELANACAQEGFSEDQPVVFESEIGGKKRKVKALCFKDNLAQQDKDAMVNFLGGIPNLTEEQRARALEQLGQQGHSHTYSWELRGGSDKD